MNILLGLIALLLALSMAPVPAAASGAGSNWIELGISHYDSDWDPRESENGLRVAGQWAGRAWYLGGVYNTVDTKAVDLPVVRLRGLPFGNWRELTLGYTRETGANSAFALEAAYLGVDLYDDTRSGHALAARFRHQLSARVWTSLRVSHLQLEDRDWRLTGEIGIRSTERVALVMRLDDFAELDFTWYEVGLRVFFD